MCRSLKKVVQRIPGIFMVAFIRIGGNASPVDFLLKWIGG